MTASVPGFGFRLSNAGDVSSKEVDAMAVEDLSGTLASRALGIAACRNECGLMWRGMPATFAVRGTIR